MEDRICSTSNPSLNRIDSSSSFSGRSQGTTLSHTSLFGSRGVVTGSQTSSHRPFTSSSSGSQHGHPSSVSPLRRAESSSTMRRPASRPANFMTTFNNLKASIRGSTSSASYPSINKLVSSCSSTCSSPSRSHHHGGGSSTGASHPATATGTPCPPIGTPTSHGYGERVGSTHRMRLAMLSQVRGYLENLKGSVDSIKDDV